MSKVLLYSGIDETSEIRTAVSRIWSSRSFNKFSFSEVSEEEEAGAACDAKHRRRAVIRDEADGSAARPLGGSTAVAGGAGDRRAQQRAMVVRENEEQAVVARRTSLAASNAGAMILGFAVTDSRVYNYITVMLPSGNIGRWVRTVPRLNQWTHRFCRGRPNIPTYNSYCRKHLQNYTPNSSRKSTQPSISLWSPSGIPNPGHPIHKKNPCHPSLPSLFLDFRR